jgi:hypothetical protein
MIWRTGCVSRPRASNRPVDGGAARRRAGTWSPAPNRKLSCLSSLASMASRMRERWRRGVVGSRALVERDRICFKRSFVHFCCLAYCAAKIAFGIMPWMPLVPSTTWVT